MAKKTTVKEKAELKVGNKYWAGKQIETIPPKYEFRFEIVEIIENAIVRARCLIASDAHKGMRDQIVSFAYKDAEKSFK